MIRHKVVAFTGGNENNTGIMACGLRVLHPNESDVAFSASWKRTTCTACHAKRDLSLD